MSPSAPRHARAALLAGLLSALTPGAPAAFAGQMIPVPSVTIYPGDIIRDGMVTEKELPDGFAGMAATVLDRSALIGKTVRRTLLPGLPIAANSVGEPKIITVGAMVRVVFVEGDLLITTYGSALQAGAVGDVIPVRNTESGLTISGEIMRDGSIKIGNG